MERHLQTSVRSNLVYFDADIVYVPYPFAALVSAINDYCCSCLRFLG